MDTPGEPGYTGGHTLVNVLPSGSDKRSTFCKRKDHAIGVALSLLAALLWTVSGFVTQILYRDGYDKPFLVTYTVTGSFSLYLVPRLIQWFREGFPGGVGVTDGYEPLATLEDSDEQVAEALDASASLQYGSLVFGEKESNLTPLSVGETAKVAFAFCWLWFIANWAVNASLNYTTVASSTIVAGTSGFFTLGIGVLFGVERFTMLKVTAVVMSFLGVVFVSLSDSQPPATSAPGSFSASTLASQDTLLGTPAHAPRPLLGDTLALISAFFYAFYVVFLKVKVKTESQIDMQLFLGFVGLFDLFTCWPVGMILHRTGMEKFELPGSVVQWSILLTIMAILFLSDYLFVISTLKTSPLLVTIGISLTIPLAVLGDFILNSPVAGQVLLGALLVLISFCCVALDSSESDGNELEEGRNPDA